MKKIGFLFLIMCTLIACTHKTDFSLQPAVSYSHDIAPLVISNCTQSGCHGVTEASRFSLLSYDDLITNTNVKPGSPDDSKLIEVITSLNAFKVMPKNPYSPLTNQQIQTIYLWVGQGAKNN